MNKKLIKLLSIALSCTCVCSAFFGCGNKNSDENSDKTVLRIASYDAGISVNWLYALEERFEKEYENRSFEENKTGVDVKIDSAKTYTIEQMIASKNHILVQGDMNIYADYERFMPLTDIVEEKCYDDGTKSISDKFSPIQKEFLYAMGGECYFIPNAQMFDGVVYDIDLFDKYNLYFAQDLVHGKSVFITDPSDAKSFGPDGQTGVKDGIDYSIDDGLPATNEEFLTLCAEMSEQGITPFIWTGKNVGYSNGILTASYNSMAGKSVEYNYTFNSGDNEIEIIDSFDSQGNPNVSKTKINGANGYLMMQQKERYQALELMQAIIDNGYYDKTSCFATSVSMMEAQAKYVKSAPTGAPIAMLAEGCYWVNEARDVISQIGEQYPKYANRKFGYLPMPTMATGTHKDVEPNVDCYSLAISCEDYMMINKRNVESSDVMKEVCKLFLQFANSDQSLSEYTAIEKTPKDLIYEMDDETLKTLPYFTQDMLLKKRIADANGVMYQYGSSNLIYRNVRLGFGMGNQATTWRNGNDVYASEAFKKGSLTAAQYFMNLRNFNSAYMQYFK